MFKNLKTSPVFNLSMASKELFHSNMLYWLCITYPNEFCEVLACLGISTRDWKSFWKPFREKKYLDFSIVDEKGRFLLIVENKVKSIADRNQLEKYRKETEDDAPQLLLLTLSTRLFQDKDILKDGWKVNNYGELSEAIGNCFKTISNSYHRELIQDYCCVIKQLHELQKDWVYELGNSYTKQFVEQDTYLKDLRLGDLHQKILYSQLAGELCLQLNATIKSNKDILEESKLENCCGKIYVNYGMTRSLGIVDVKVRVRQNLLLVVQLQGKSYKHCIECLDKEEKSKSLFTSVISFLQIGKTESAFVKAISNCCFLGGGKYTLAGYPFSEGAAMLPKLRTKNNCCHYTDSFVYQYVNLTDRTSVQDVINAIKKDITAISDLLRDLSNF